MRWGRVPAGGLASLRESEVPLSRTAGRKSELVEVVVCEGGRGRDAGESRQGPFPSVSAVLGSPLTTGQGGRQWMGGERGLLFLHSTGLPVCTTRCPTSAIHPVLPPRLVSEQGSAESVGLDRGCQVPRSRGARKERPREPE
jgi:hypothetical protein